MEYDMKLLILGTVIGIIIGTIVGFALCVYITDDMSDLSTDSTEPTDEPDINLTVSFLHYTAIYYYYEKEFADHWEITLNTDQPVNVIVIGDGDEMFRYDNVTSIVFGMPWLHHEQIIQFEIPTHGTARIIGWVDRGDER